MRTDFYGLIGMRRRSLETQETTVRKILPIMRRFFLPVGFLGGLGLVIVPSGGCASVHPVADMPVDLAEPIRACAVLHERHIEGSDHTVKFDAALVNGRIDSLFLVESTLRDEDLEKCLAAKIRSFTIDDLPLRHSANLERDPLQPESRELLGNPAAAPLAACLAYPPCLLGLVVVMGAAVITVQLTVYSATTTAPAIATPATTATPVPTTTATATPTATATTTTTSPPIISNRDRWQCTASCNVQQIDQKANCPPRVTGSAGGPNEPAACVEAKRTATQSTPTGCYPRHCQCRCAKR